MASSSVLVCAVLVLVQLVLSVGNHHAFAAKSDDGNIYMKNIETLGSLIPAADSKAIESLSGLKSGVFLISLATRGARAGCGGVKDQEFLGFNNRTCTTSLSPKTTAGPVMRGASKSMMWREWMVRVVGEDDTGKNNSTSKKLISLQAFIHPDVENKARCLGYVSSFYNNPEYQWTCNVPPYGDGLFLNGTAYNTSEGTIHDNSQLWSVQPVGDDDQQQGGEFVLIAATKPDVCARALAARGCDALATLAEYPVEDSTGENTYTAWKFIKRYDIVSPGESPTPVSPVPAVSPSLPSPSPLSVTSIPGPTITAPSFTSSGSVRVTFQDLGGNNQCYVRSFTVTYSGNTIGSVAKTKTVDASNPGLTSEGILLNLQERGYNSIYAVGKCASGERTEISNQLSVFNSVSSGSAPTGILVEYSLFYQQDESYFISEETRRQVCKNLLALSPSGTCVVTSVVAGGDNRRLRNLLVSNGSSSVSGSVQYDRAKDGEQLFDDLDNPSSSTLATLADGIVNSTSEVSVEAVSKQGIRDSLVPGPPGFVTSSNISTSNTTISWLDGKPGDPEETYSVNCVASATSSCTDSGVDVTGISRGTQSELVSGLTPNTTYSCWVKASNKAGEVCSSNSAVFTTLIAADPATNVSVVSISSTTITVSWTDGSEGNPTEIYTVNCVGGSTSSCTQAGEKVTGISRGTEQGTVTGLTPGTQYKCWVVATNTLGSVCSDPVTETSLKDTGAPTNVSLTNTTTTSMSFSWTDGAEGVPQESYNITCTTDTSSTDCQNPGGSVQSVTGISRGTEQGTVTGLTPGTQYKCWVVATNAAGSVCSDPVTETSLKDAGAPTITSVVQGRKSSIVDVTWQPGSDSIPSAADPAFFVTCVSSGAACPTPAFDENRPSGATTTQVTGLSANVTYTCYVIASNAAGNPVCSSPTQFQTRYVSGLLGVNQDATCGTDGDVWINKDIYSPDVIWEDKSVLGYISTASSLSGLHAAVINTAGNVVATDDVRKDISSWIIQAGASNAQSVSIGADKQGVYVDASFNTYYTADLTVSGATFGNATASPSSNNIIQVSMSGFAVLGRSASNVYYIPDASSASPTWNNITPPGVTAPASVSLNDTSAVVAEGKNMYYTSDVSASPVSWSSVTMPTDSIFTGSSGIFGTSLSGKQIILSVDLTVPGGNIFVAPDVTSTPPQWQLLSQSAYFVSISGNSESLL